MDTPPLSWTFGDPTGWTIGAGLFALVSALLGWGVYGVSYRLLAMGSLDQSVPASRQGSIILGIVIGAVVFAGFYFTSLSGFSRLELGHDLLTIRYILPERAVTLPFIEVRNVQEEPTYKGQWRLLLVTDANGIYESALSSQADVHRAAETLRQQMANPFASGQ